MKKTVKTIISIVLCVVMAVCVAAPSFAKEQQTAFVVVSGMNTFPLYDNDDGTTAFPMTSKVMVKMIAGLVPPIVRFAVDKDYDALAAGLMPAAFGGFEKLACDENGDSIYNVDTRIFNGCVADSVEYFENEFSDELGVVNAGIQAYGAENTYFFNYDWRIDPLVHADSLNDFITDIKNENKYDRIVLSAYSMGGTVVCSYLNKYGSDDLDSLLLASTAFQGSSAVGTLFSGDIELDMSALIKRMAQLTRDNTLEDLLNGLNEALETAGVNTNLEKFINNLVWEMQDSIYADLLTPIFGYMPGLWALVPDEYYEAAKEYMLAANQSEKLTSRIDEYHYNVQCKAEEILNEAQKDTNLYLIAQYNMQGLPVSETSSNSNNDYLIDTEYEAGGAICSKLGETLPADYTQAVADGHNHLSYDNQIDASTGMFPEQTWFIRDMAHVDFPVGESTDFIIWLVDSETQLTVHDSEKYSQFLKFSSGDGSLKPTNEESMKPTFADRVLEVFVKIIHFVAEILAKFVVA